MSTLADELTISEMVVPTSVDAPDATEFRTMVEIGNRQALWESGIEDLADTPEQLLPSWLDQTDRTRHGFIARRGSQIVGAAQVDTTNQEGATSAEAGVSVLPENWGSGIERALLERIEQDALALGRRTMQSWTLHPVSGDKRMLVPLTGWGAVPATPAGQLFETNGYVLEQVERNSTLSLDRPLALAEEKLRAAELHAGDDYRSVAWTLPTPPHLRDGYAALITRMATDIPSGGLDVHSDAWDAERVVRQDRRFAEGGQTVSVAAVEHVPSGALVAFNELVIGSDPRGVTHQFGTLVVTEHRGRRLGTIVKCANLLRWQSIAPRSPKISTFNAEENRPMLDINEAIGFVPASYAAAWQKRLV